MMKCPNNAKSSPPDGYKQRAEGTVSQSTACQQWTHTTINISAQVEAAEEEAAEVATAAEDAKAEEAQVQAPEEEEAVEKLDIKLQCVRLKTVTGVYGS